MRICKCKYFERDIASIYRVIQKLKGNEFWKVFVRGIVQKKNQKKNEIRGNEPF